jgi:hypothetical protein
LVTSIKPHALVGRAVDDALRLQEAQRFAHRHPADAEVAGDLGLHQPVARQEGAARGGGDDGLAACSTMVRGCTGRRRRTSDIAVLCAPTRPARRRPTPVILVPRDDLPARFISYPKWNVCLEGERWAF